MYFDNTVRLRRTILRIMLGTLAAAAGLAVLGVMTSSFDEEFKIIGTGIAAAISSGLLLATCKLLDSEISRNTGLLLMVFIVVEFLLTLVMFWYSSSALFGQLVFMSLIFPLVALPAAVFFHVRQFRGGKLAGFLGMGLCAVAFGVFMLADWSSWSLLGNNTKEERYWEWACVCWVFAFVTAATTAGVGRDRRHWRWVGFTAGLIAFVMWLYGIWHEAELPSDLAIILGTVAILVGHVNILWLCRLEKSQEWMRLATAVFAGVAGVCFDLVAIEQSGFSLEFIWHCGTAAGICAGCGTVAVAILTAFNRRPTNPASNSGVDLTEIPLTCPVCQRKESIPLRDGVGEMTCGGCGMIYFIRARAPQCAGCGYLLLMFRGERCPECGIAIASPVSVSPASMVSSTGEAC